MNIDGIKNALGDLLAKLPIERFRDPPPVVGVLRLDGVIGRSAAPDGRVCSPVTNAPSRNCSSGRT